MASFITDSLDSGAAGISATFSMGNDNGGELRRIINYIKIQIKLGHQNIHIYIYGSGCCIFSSIYYKNIKYVFLM